MSKFEGEYKCLTRDEVFKFVQENENEGKFEIYINGKSKGEKNKRYKTTWKKIDDVLILEYDDDTMYYFLAIDDGIIMLDDVDSPPDFSDYIAPNGKTFNYKINGKTFFENGTYEYEMSDYGTATGCYYREDNIIYCKDDPFSGYEKKFGSVINYPGESKYSAEFFIYNDNYITRAQDVFLKN